MMKAYKTELVSLVSALGLLSMLAFASSAVAADGAQRGPGFDGPMIISERMADRLGLDDVQRESVKNILDAAKPEFDALRDRVEADIKAVLTEEQLAELDQMKQRMRDGVREGKGRRGGKRGGNPESEAETS
jgi:Spy/CpxP family protein refolding chaperone